MMPTTLTSGVVFRRVNGPVWALYGPHTTLKVGATITVARRDGTPSTVVVGQHIRRDEHGLVYARIDTTNRYGPLAEGLTPVSPLARFEAMPDGYYAVSHGTGIAFHMVERPRRGRYAGRMVVRRVVAGRPGRVVLGSASVSVLDAIIDFGITEARELYARETVHCYVCNRHLTDETSRALGIGPICLRRQRDTVR